MATPISYLQTLSHHDAIAFIESLQRVKSHLSGELEWMHHQVQQKTIQLQGIETLISEAIELGLTTADPSPADEVVPPTSVETEHPMAENGMNSLVEAGSATANGNGASNQTAAAAGSTPTTSIPPTPEPVAPVAKAQANSKNPQNLSKPPKPKAQSGATNKTSASPAKKVSQSQRLTSKVSKPGNTKELKHLLAPKFEGKTLTDAVAQILENAAKPLHLNELLSQMYGKLSAQDFKRAKISLANVLSVGKKEGKWQNLGEGLYAANQVAK